MVYIDGAVLFMADFSVTARISDCKFNNNTASLVTNCVYFCIFYFLALNMLTLFVLYGNDFS